MNIADLRKLNQDQLEDELSWVDWREYDIEVANLFSRFLDSSLKFSCVENEDVITISLDDINYKVDMTQGGPMLGWAFTF